MQERRRALATFHAIIASRTVASRSRRVPVPAFLPPFPVGRGRHAGAGLAGGTVVRLRRPGCREGCPMFTTISFVLMAVAAWLANRGSEKDRKLYDVPPEGAIV